MTTQVPFKAPLILMAAPNGAYKQTTDHPALPVTQSSTPMSRTLNRLDLTPLTLCAFCPAAIWMSPIPITKEKLKLKIFCSLMRVLITEELLECDGEAIATAQKEAQEAKALGLY